MMLLTLHIIAVGFLILIVGTMAYRMGYGKAEGRYKRALERARAQSPDPERSDVWN